MDAVADGKLLRTQNGRRATALLGMYMNSSANVPLYGDGNWVDAWPRADHTPPPNYEGGDHTQGMRRFFVDRHNKGIQLAYTDGHVEFVRLQALWT